MAASPASAACPGVFATATCDGGSGGAVCSLNGAQILCNLGVTSHANGSNAKFVTNAGTFEGYGYEGDGEAFCCTIAQSENCTFKATGTNQVDTVNLYDNVRSLDLDCGYHEVYTLDAADVIGGSRLSAVPELLDGDSENDLIHGNDGDETIIGDGGADTLYGDGGADIIECGSGNDLAYGGDGVDEVYGESGDDDLYGDDGDDLLYGGTDSDLVCGGNDADALYGDDGDDFVHGQWGTDNPNDGGVGTDTCEAQNAAGCESFFSSMICTR